MYYLSNVRRLIGIVVAITFITAELMRTTPASAQGRSVSLVRDTEIENTIRVYLAPIFKVAGLDPSAVRVHLVESDVINAFVAGGQRIFVHTGLIMQADNAEQIIGVLAHETGHITGGHLTQFRDNIEDAQASAIAGLLLGLGAALATGQGDAAAAGASLGQHLGTRQFLQFTRENEQAADQAAVEFLDKAGITSEGLYEFMQKLLKREQIYVGNKENAYSQTHPLSKDRVEFLRHHLSRSEYADTPVSDVYDRLFDRASAKLFGYLKPELALQRYPESDDSLSARYGRAIAHMRRQELEKALDLVDGLIESDPNDPFFYELKGDILRNAGRMSAAVEPYEKAVELLPWAGLIRVNLAQTLLDTNTEAATNRALDQLRQAARYEPDVDRVWILKAKAHDRRGEQGLVDLSQAELSIRNERATPAKAQAQKAMESLETGSPAWLRAQDIVFRAEDILAREK